MVPYKGKTEYLYNEIFSEIKRIYLLDRFWKEFTKIYKKNFKDAIVFSLFKITLEYCKKIWIIYKRCNKEYKNTLFILKIFPFIFIGEREELFEKVENYYIDEKDNYKKMIKYF